MKRNNRNRILARVVARELTKEEIRMITGGNSGSSSSENATCTNHPWGGDHDVDGGTDD